MIKRKKLWIVVVILSALVLLVIRMECVKKHSSYEKSEIGIWVARALSEAYYHADKITTEEIADLIPKLLGAKITRDQAISNVEKMINELSVILVEIKSMYPPFSAMYESDLRQAHTLLIESLKARIASLECFIDYINCHPPNGGMPNDLEKASRHIKEASSKIGEFKGQLDEACKILMKVKP